MYLSEILKSAFRKRRFDRHVLLCFGGGQKRWEGDDGQLPLRRLRACELARV
jgi:hypothetical protein